MTVHRIAVAGSSNVDEARYHEGSRVLEVVFKGGRCYRYSAVPPEAWEALQGAESIGKFVAGYVKGAYEFEPGEYEPCPEPDCEWPAGHDEEEQPHGKRTWDE